MAASSYRWSWSTSATALRRSKAACARPTAGARRPAWRAARPSIRRQHKSSSSNSSVTKLPDAESLLPRLVDELKARVTPASAMIGLHTGGAWLAERLHPLLGLKEPLGLMDIAFYRDDYSKEGLKHDPKRTRIPFEVEGREILLVDDVLYTGRTVRAAMNELFDYGRPKSIALVVLADRGGRQLPISAQYCGTQLEVPAGKRLRLKRADNGKLSLELTDAG